MSDRAVIVSCIIFCKTNCFPLTYGPAAPGRENLQYSSFYFLKGKDGLRWEMKVSEFGQLFPFPNEHGIWIIEENISKKVS